MAEETASRYYVSSANEQVLQQKSHLPLDELSSEVCENPESE